MPELPEVQTVCKGLEPIVINRTIKSIEVLRASAIEGNPEVFIKSLQGETFKTITRIGKYIIFHLTNKKVIISHLRMEGKYYHYKENEPNSDYARVIFHLDNGEKLCYDDSRSFGRLKLSNENIFLKEKEISKLGPEPFNANAEEIYQKVKDLSQPIKATLLDQTVMCGLGNIYCDEVLFACHLHPLTPTNEVKNWNQIIKESSRILNEAIKAGGSTIKSYHPTNNIDGMFQASLQVYGHKGNACPNCGSKLKFIKVGGRGTTFCPTCQKQNGPISVAIFGNVASGKSTVTQYFKSKGFTAISADEIVANLYKTGNFLRKLNKVFNQDFSIDNAKNEIRKLISEEPSNKKKLENIIFPIVKKKINEAKKAAKTPIFFAEVPLLFEANMQNNFDYIIAVDVDEKNQLQRLEKRDPQNAKFLAQINKNNSFIRNKKKADFIINNDGDLNSLYKQLNEVIRKVANCQ